MAQIPDVSQLGARPQVSGRQSIKGYDLSPAYRAQAGVAEAVGVLGDGINTIVRKKEDSDAKLQAAYAGSGLLKRILDTEKELQGEQDYTKHEKLYGERMQLALSDVSSQIKSPEARAMFEASAQDTILRGLDRVRGNVSKLEESTGRARLEQLLEQNTNSYLIAPDDATRASINGIVNDAIENNKFLMPLEKFRKRSEFLNGAQTAKLESLPADQRVAIYGDMLAQQSSMDSPQLRPVENIPTDFNASVRFLLGRVEGGKLVENDGGRGPSKYGVVGSLHGLSPDEVKSLTPEKAAEIYKRDYWDAIGADSLPESMRLAAFDTAVNFGKEAAKEMIAASGGDPKKLIDIRRQRHDEIAANKPDTHAQYKKGWESRNDLLERTLYGAVVTPENKDTFAIDRTKLKALYERAQQDQRADIASVEFSQRQLEKQKKAVQDGRMNDYLTAALSGNLSLEDIKKDDLLDFDQREKIISMQQRVAERGEKTDPTVFNDLLRRIHSPDGSGEAITSQDQLLGYVGRGIGYDGLQKLRSELSGKGQPVGEMKRRFDEAKKQQITGKSIFDAPDQKKEEAYYKWWVMKEGIAEQKKKEGIPENELYDPSSKNYLGSTADAFVTTMESMDSSLSDKKKEPDKYDLNTPDGLKNAVRDKKIALDEGKKIAIKNGWIKNEPEVPISK